MAKESLTQTTVVHKGRKRPHSAHEDSSHSDCDKSIASDPETKKRTKKFAKSIVKRVKTTFFDVAFQINAKVRKPAIRRPPTGYGKQNDVAIWEPAMDEQLYAPYAFTFLTTLVLLWACIGFLITFTLEYNYDPSHTYMKLDRGFSPYSMYFMFCGCGLGLITGLAGLIFICTGLSSFFTIYDHALWIISGLHLAAMLFSIGKATKTTTGMYHRLFEASAFAMMDDYKYIDLWGTENRFVWNQMQLDMKCCGLAGPEDWLRSPYNKIPLTCCSRYHTHACEEEITAWNELPSENRSYETVRPILNTEGCLDNIHVERSAAKWDWVVYPSMLFIFHSLMAIKLDYLVTILERQFKTDIGYDILIECQDKIKRYLKKCFCQPWISCYKCLRRYGKVQAKKNKITNDDSFYNYSTNDVERGFTQTAVNETFSVAEDKEKRLVTLYSK